jgi:uncharacterized protein YukE
MATQVIRNIVNTQVDSVLVRAEEELRNEGKKKQQELQDKIPTPPEIIEKLKAEISKYACSEKGKAKFQKKYDQIDNNLSKVENILNGAIEKIEAIESKIKPIFEEDGPLKKVWEVVDFMNTYIVPVLQAAVLLIDAALTANSGPASSGKLTKSLSDRQILILGKLKEIVQIGLTVPLMVQFYKEIAQSMLLKMDPLKQKLTMIKDKIVMLKLFIFGLLNQFLSECAVSENTGNTSTGNEGVPPPEEDTLLSDYLNLLSTHYVEVYEALKAAGDEKAVERIFAVKENLEEDYNISFKVINLN